MTVLSGRYRVLRPLGRGGMAEVVVAHDERLGRDVAVKLIHPGLLTDPTSRQRLFQEARAAAALHHPHTVGVFDVGEDDGQPFVVMELVRGGSLADRLRDRGSLPPDEVVQVGTAVLAGLEAAHGAGIIHRDVKPSNVLIGADGAAKLADFGIAKALTTTDPALTSTGQVMGSPRYLAPEVAAGRAATAASDLYALGVVLYECLAGAPPFHGETPIAVALAHQRDPVSPLRTVAPATPADLAAVVERALHKDPQERFASAAAMRDALQGAGGGGTTMPLPTDDPDVAARPSEGAGQVPSGAGGGRWATVAATLAGLAVLAAVVAAGIGTPFGDDGGTSGEVDAGASAGGDPAGDGQDEPGPTPPGQDGEVSPGQGADEGPRGGGAPEDLDELISGLARAPDAAGRHGGRLLDELIELRQEDAEDQPEEARKLLTELSSWIARAHLEPQTGRETVAVLGAVGRPDAPELEEANRLFAEVALDRDGWGRKGKDLLDDLKDLLGVEDPADRADDAADIVEELGAWVEKGDIDPDLAARARPILERLARQPG